MNDFLAFMNDIVCLIKQNGNKYENIKADVQTSTIFIDDSTLPIEEGDKIIRKLPNGLIENYLVIDRGYYSEFEGIEAHYQVKVRKETSLNNNYTKKEGIINNYHVTGANSRINVKSIDNSVNTVGQNNNDLFNELREIVNKNIKENNDDILEAISLMEQNQDTTSFKESFDNFIAKSANYMTLLTPFIPKLTELF